MDSFETLLGILTNPFKLETISITETLNPIVINFNLAIPRKLLNHLLLLSIQREVTLITILIVPEYYTALNKRRDLIATKKLDLLTELDLIRLLLTLHPKLSSLWIYRCWLLRQSTTIDHLNELNIVLIAASSYKQNYSAFSFARLVLLNVDCVSVYLEIIREWTRLNVSDQSGWNFRGMYL